MSLAIKIAPFFQLSAAAIKDGKNVKDMSSVAAYLDNANLSPTQAGEFEWAAGCVFANHDLDIQDDHAWQTMGVAGGHAEAVHKMKSAYLKAVPVGLDQLKTVVEAFPHAYKPSELGNDNWVNRVVTSLHRAHRDESPDFILNDDTAWQQAGIKSAADFQTQVRDIFKTARVGIHLATDMKDDVDALSVQAADYAIRKTFPALADKLDIAADVGEQLRSQPKASPAQASGFGKARDCQPY